MLIFAAAMLMQDIDLRRWMWVSESSDQVGWYMERRVAAKLPHTGIFSTWFKLVPETGSKATFSSMLAKFDFDCRTHRYAEVEDVTYYPTGGGIPNDRTYPAVMKSALPESMAEMLVIKVCK